MKLSCLALLFVCSLSSPLSAEAKGKKENKTEAAEEAGKTAPKAAKADKSAKAEKKEPKLLKETRANGLKVEDLKLGSGMEARVGSRVTMHYKGSFLNGKQFDANLDQADPEPFTLDKNHLIAGWVEGVPGMKVGGKRKLLIPYALAYGEKGTPDGTIPPKSDLVFELELLKVE